MELTRTYDSRADFAAQWDRSKIDRYQPIVDRFNAVGQRSGWEAVVLPFTVGIRGSLQESAWSVRLSSLGLPESEIPLVLRAVIEAALASLDTVFGVRSSLVHEREYT